MDCAQNRFSLREFGGKLIQEMAQVARQFARTPSPSMAPEFRRGSARQSSLYDLEGLPVSFLR